MIVHVGVSADKKRIKFAEDVDTLSPDIRQYNRLEFASLDDLMIHAHLMETVGYRVCIDFTCLFYETE